MDDETRSALMEASGKLLVPVVREVVVREYDMRTLERRNQQEIDLLRKKQEVMDEHAAEIEADADAGGDSPDARDGQPDSRPDPEPEPETATADDEVAAAFEEMKQKEDCPICASLLDGLRDLPPAERIQGMSEYGRFKSFAEDPDVTEEELVEKIHEMPVLREVIEAEVGPTPEPPEDAEPAEVPA